MCVWWLVIHVSKKFHSILYITSSDIHRISKCFRWQTIRIPWIVFFSGHSLYDLTLYPYIWKLHDIPLDILDYLGKCVAFLLLTVWFIENEKPVCCCYFVPVTVLTSLCTIIQCFIYTPRTGGNSVEGVWEQSKVWDLWTGCILATNVSNICTFFTK